MLGLAMRIEPSGNLAYPWLSESNCEQKETHGGHGGHVPEVLEWR